MYIEVKIVDPKYPAVTVKFIRSVDSNVFVSFLADFLQIITYVLEIITIVSNCLLSV